jgi:hypothetical protein
MAFEPQGSENSADPFLPECEGRLPHLMPAAQANPAPRHIIRLLSIMTIAFFAQPGKCQESIKCGPVARRGLRSSPLPPAHPLAVFRLLQR